ncbi:MAG: UDP-glucose--hexose-1-phosphate uridylyltransferase [Bacteroidota bacterium]
MEPSNFNNVSHRRYNILTGEWILVSPHRTKRPWQGQQETLVKEKRLSYDPNCYLCPGNERANGDINPNYEHTFVFDNDFSAIQNGVSHEVMQKGLLRAETETGRCRVVCFSPDHSKSLANLSIESIEKIVEVWQEQFKDLASEKGINYIQIFENKGSVMGCSNPHPHGQIWAQRSIPNEVYKKDYNQKNYFQNNQKSLLGECLVQEVEEGERIIFQNDHMVVLVPFWAIWPYEVMIIPRKQQPSILEMSKQQRLCFAEAISVITRAYDQLFKVSFPYSSGIHQAPTNTKDNNHWHWHMSFYPPLLRSATVKKFMVGYEMFASPQRDHTPEYAASVLRDLIQ